MVRVHRLAASLSSRGKTVPFASPGQTILTVGGRRVVVGGSAAKTYAAFQAHIATLATGGAKAWGALTSGYVDGAYTTTAAAEAGTMRGSPWSNRSVQSNSWAPCRVIQHGLFSNADFLAQIAAGRDIFFRMAVAGDVNEVFAYARNGYTSLGLSGAGPYPVLSCPEIIYWDGTQAQRMQPSLGLGPTPYTW